MTSQLELGQLEVNLLQLFPQSIRISVLDDRSFREASGLKVEAQIRLGSDGAIFQRSLLFGTARNILADRNQSAALDDSEGRSWTASYVADRNGIVLSNDQSSILLPDFSCLDPDTTKRIEWFDREAEVYRINDERSANWRKVLSSRSVDDEEVDALISEFRFSPRSIAAALPNLLRGPTVDITKIIPGDPRYYERLIGAPSDDLSLQEYIAQRQSPRIAKLLEHDSIESLKQAFLLCSHLWVSQSISLQELNPVTVVEFYRWLELSGDRTSQLGAIEVGLASLDFVPEILPILIALIKKFVADSPSDREDRLSLICSLVVLVDGEFARTGIFRERRPYWRRAASIAHAAVLERAITEMNIAPSEFEWGRHNRGTLYYMQTYIDMRQEPRWHPDFILPDQLDAEFSGRIFSAGQLNNDSVKSTELRELLQSDLPGAIKCKVTFPYSYMPGPLEGGVESMAMMPLEVERKFISDLDQVVLTPGSFAPLLNSSLIFRISPSLAQLTANGLRRVKYQLQDIQSGEHAFSLLSGLAIVASVTRTPELADEIRILMRVVRRSAGITLSSENAIRISLVAAAAHSDIKKWATYIGQSLTEHAFEDIGHDEAINLRERMRVLIQLEPELWRGLARADAALASFLQSKAQT